jgi:hypothetical protein
VVISGRSHQGKAQPVVQKSPNRWNKSHGAAVLGTSGRWWGDDISSTPANWDWKASFRSGGIFRIEIEVVDAKVGWKSRILNRLRCCGFRKAVGNSVGCIIFSMTAIFHYTDANGLKGILSSNTLFATHYKYLNDLTEAAASLQS